MPAGPLPGRAAVVFGWRAQCSDVLQVGHLVQLRSARYPFLSCPPPSLATSDMSQAPAARVLLLLPCRTSSSSSCLVPPPWRRCGWCATRRPARARALPSCCSAPRSVLACRAGAPQGCCMPTGQGAPQREAVGGRHQRWAHAPFQARLCMVAPRWVCTLKGWMQAACQAAGSLELNQPVVHLVLRQACSRTVCLTLHPTPPVSVSFWCRSRRRPPLRRLSSTRRGRWWAGGS